MKLSEYQKREKFIPLTYIEVLQNKPLIIKLNKDWNFVTYLQSAVNFAGIVDIKDSLLLSIEEISKRRPRNPGKRTEKSIALITAIKALIEVVFDISKQEYEGEKLDKYREFCYTYFIKNVDTLIDVWAKVMEFNSRLEKKNVVPVELQSDSRPRSMDKWRGFFHKRRCLNTPFLQLLHEDEETTILNIRQYRTQKQNEKKSKRGTGRKFPGKVS